MATSTQKTHHIFSQFPVPIRPILVTASCTHKWWSILLAASCIHKRQRMACFTLLTAFCDYKWQPFLLKHTIQTKHSLFYWLDPVLQPILLLLIALSIHEEDLLCLQSVPIKPRTAYFIQSIPYHWRTASHFTHNILYPWSTASYSTHSILYPHKGQPPISFTVSCASKRQPPILFLYP